MKAEITTEGLKIDGRLIPPTARDLDAALGASHREIEIPLHGGGVRRICVFDELGFVYYVDETPPEVPVIWFALFPQDAPFSAGSAFSGCLQVNGTPLTVEMTEATLPATGELRFEPQFGHKWRAVTPKFSVWLLFCRRKNRLGKRTGVPRLAEVSICYDDHGG